MGGCIDKCSPCCYGTPAERAPIISKKELDFKQVRVTTVAGRCTTSGYEDGPGTTALFNQPGGLHFLADGSLVVSDSGNNVLRKITIGGNDASEPSYTVSTFYDKKGSLHCPKGLTSDDAGFLYFTDWETHVIKKITPAGDKIEAFAGVENSPGHADDPDPHRALFRSPIDVTYDPTTRHFFVSDWGNHRIRKIAPDGAVTTIAGDGTAGYRDGAGSEAQFHWPSELDCIASKDELSIYLPDDQNHAMRKLTAPRDNLDAFSVSTVAGGSKAAEVLDHPWGIAAGPDGFLYLSDSGHYEIKRIAHDGSVVETIVSESQMGKDGKPDRMLMDSTGSRLYFIQGNAVRLARFGVD